jgi:hypothetical protein
MCVYIDSRRIDGGTASLPPLITLVAIVEAMNKAQMFD